MFTIMKRLFTLILGMVLAAGIMGYSPPPTVNTDDCQESVMFDFNHDVELEASVEITPTIQYEYYDSGPLHECYYTLNIAPYSQTTLDLDTPLEDDYPYNDIGVIAWDRTDTGPNNLNAKLPNRILTYS